MRKLIYFFVFLFLISPFSYALTSAPDIYCNSAILIDARTGNVLFEKSSNQKAYPASTTKVLTSYIALSQGIDCNAEIIPSRNAVMSVPTGSSIAYFSENEKLTFEQVLYGLLLPSGNDAANILAEHISGSNSNFADLMNATAENLGMTNSHFVNPSGWHNDEHYTTASDLAKVAREAMKIDKFREIVKQQKYNMPPTNVSKQTRPFTNTNKLLHTDGEYYYPFATGIKTGYTSQAGNCLIASAYKDGVELISVVLGGHTIPVGKSATYIDTINLFNYGFENYHNVQLASKNQVITTITPKNAKKIELKKEENSSVAKITKSKILNLVAADNVNSLVQNGDTPVFDKIINVNNKISAPIKKGEVLGTVTYTKNGEIVQIINLLSERDVEKEHVICVILRLLPYFIFSVIILGVILIIYNTIRKFIRKKKRKRITKGNR